MLHLALKSSKIYGIYDIRELCTKLEQLLYINTLKFIFIKKTRYGISICQKSLITVEKWKCQKILSYSHE